MSGKRRYNYKRIFGSLLWALLGMATVVLLGAAMSLRNNKRCKGVNINISGAQNNFFIDKKEIGSIIEKLCGGTLTGKKLGSFNLAIIENTLKKDQWIKNAELFFDNNEILRVEVIEREPVARIFTNNGSSFYLDTALTRLPLSDKVSARVPVFSNFPVQANMLTKADSNLLKGVKNISAYILKDPFWMAQIDQIDITADKTFEMIPKVGNQIIVFGNADNYEEKFNNLLTFYKQVATKVGWNKYSKIDVQYKGQIVALKRGAEDVILDLLRTKQIMQSIVVNAQKQANDSINNIQLEQQQEDNTIPVAPLLDDIPDEQPIAGKLMPGVTAPPENKISQPMEKSFWINPPNVLKTSGPTKTKSTSNEKPNPNLPKKIIVLKSSTTKPINKPINKTVNKIKTEPKAKPKAVMPPKNDY